MTDQKLPRVKIESGPIEKELYDWEEPLKARYMELFGKGHLKKEELSERKAIELDKLNRIMNILREP